MFECDLTPSRSQASRQAAEFRQRIADRAVVDKPIELRHRIAEITKIEIIDESCELRAQLEKSQSLLAATIEELKAAHQKINSFGIPTIAVHRIINLLAECEGVSKVEILSQRRDKRVLCVRHMVFYLCGTLTDFSLPALGRILGRDHTTVLHSKQKITAQRLIDHALDAKLAFYEQQLGATV